MVTYPIWCPGWQLKADMIVFIFLGFCLSVFLCVCVFFSFTGEIVEAANPVTPCPFKVGDKVRCDLETEVLKQMQEGHGGWNQRMSEVSG
jgi:hypothetical protein